MLSCSPFRWIRLVGKFVTDSSFAVTLSATAPFITDKTDETDGTCYEAALRDTQTTTASVAAG